MTTNRLLFILEMTRLVEDRGLDPIEGMVYQTLALRLTGEAFLEMDDDWSSAA
jgi:hypothetical protein